MAYATDIRATETGLLPRLTALLNTAKAAAHQRRMYRTTVRELGALSARDLDDLGIHRSQIRDIARQAAYGA